MPLGANHPPLDYDNLPFGEPHQVPRRRGYHERDYESLLKTRPLTMRPLERKRERGASEETPPAATGLPLAAESHTAVVEDNEIAKQHVQWRGSTMRETSGFSPGGLVGWRRRCDLYLDGEHLWVNVGIETHSLGYP